MHKSLLLIAHGSRRETSNDEIRELAQRLRVTGSGGYHQIDCAFLELASPSIPDGIEALINGGAQHVVVLPYFLAAGNHVMKDIPAEVAQKQREHPDVSITIAPYLGTAQGIPEILLSLAAATG